VECEEFGFALLDEIPYNNIYDLSERKGYLL
jgi:hypothetical protein